MKKFFSRIDEFIERHIKAFVKSKHGYPILMGIETNNLADGINMIIPVIYKVKPTSKSKIVLSGNKVVELYFEIIKTTTRLIKEIIFSKLRMFECAGFKQPLRFSYCKLSDEEKENIEEIYRKCSVGITRPKVDINLKIEGKKSDLIGLIEFFNKDWYFEGYISD